MTEESVEQIKERKRKARKIFFNVLFFCLGLFLLGYGFLAMLFNFKVGLMISVSGFGILFYLLYRAYNP